MMELAQINISKK